MVLELTTHHWLPRQRPKVASEFVEINIGSEGALVPSLSSAATTQKHLQA